MQEKYDNQVYQIHTQVKEAFAYIEEIPVATAVIDLELNYIILGNSIFSEIFSVKNYPFSIKNISSYDFSSFVREIELTKANLIVTNSEMTMLNSLEGKKINADVRIKLSNRIKANLAIMSVFSKPVIDTKEVIENVEEKEVIKVSNAEFLKNIAERLPALCYVYDIETTEIIYLNEYTKGFFKGCSNEDIVSKLGIHTDVTRLEENVLAYEKSISGVWFKMAELTSLWSNNRVVKLGVGVDITESKREDKKISASSITDELTGIYNKIVGYNRLQECIERVQEEDKLFTLCYIDIDKLNYVNDNFGNKEGDKYIKNVVNTIRKIIRRSDVFARIGGDEFIIVLCDCPVITAERIMRSINKKLEEINIEESALYEYAISYGLIEVNKKMELKLENLIESAENEMCRYKFESKRK